MLGSPGEAWDIRQEFEGRPALLALLGLVVGLTAVSHPLNLVALLLLIWLRTLNGRCWCAGLFVVGLALAPSVPAALSGRSFWSGEGTVSSSVRVLDGVQRCEVRTLAGPIDLSLKGGPDLGFGDRITVQGVAIPYSASEERVERQFSLGAVRAGAGDVTIESHGSWVAQAARAWRNSFERSLSSLPPEAGEVVEGSMFGSDELSPSLAKRLRAAGAISVLSVSGLQVVLLSALWLGALAQLPIPRGWALLGLAFVLALYVSAAGLHAGGIRAALMMVVVSVAYLVRRTPDVLSALGVSALVELLWRPVWVFDFGFQLSFLVVGTLAMWLPSRARISRVRPGARVGWCLAGLGLLFLAATPLVAYQTGRVSVLSPALGALIAVAVAPMFGLSLVGWMVGLAHSGLGAAWFQWVVSPFAGWILACSDFGARFGAGIGVPAFSGYILIPIYVLFALGGRFASSAFSGERRR